MRQYANSQRVDVADTMNFVVVSNFEEHLAKLGVNSSCPQCSSTSISKYGKRNNIQVFKCKDCSKRFTRFSGTALEKTRWHWDIWLKVLEMTLNGYSIEDMRNVLINDYDCLGIDIKTVWLWRLKLITAMANMPMPILSGVVQVDETFVRESQKGSRHLKSTISQTDVRKPRYGRQSSKYGVMGSEFATVVTAVDNRGYCVCKVASLGKLSTDIFYDLFHDHLDSPAFLCSDANSIYEDYCQVTNTPHYVRPSNFLKVIGNKGYVIQATDEFEKRANNKILEHLYYEGVTDKITNRGEILFDKFNDIKYQNSLSLARVNELHNDIKRFINRNMTNVSTKYLQDYIGYFTYIRNWRIEHGYYPTSKADAEAIFIEILKTKKNLTSSEVRQKELVLPKPSSRYMEVLKAETKKARTAIDNPYFKFNEEDGVYSFNKREYLLDLPKSRLFEIAKECHLTKYRKLAHWSLVSLILKQDNIQDIIYQQLAKDRNQLIDEEDLEVIRSSVYAQSSF
ncbi:transposase-like zinc-binding domain-containing protein [Streptococcus downei]|uniref:transposase-like zinc-binding domain-containing protein n=1 Tax=Streptococcus downei TaxID=1317 RepID=UPI001F49412E|nr:DNA-binding protein [Streptococcus downei]